MTDQTFRPEARAPRGFADVRERTYYRVVGLTGADAALAAGAIATLGAVVATTWRLGVLRGALG